LLILDCLFFSGAIPKSAIKNPKSGYSSANSLNSSQRISFSSSLVCRASLKEKNRKSFIGHATAANAPFVFRWFVHRHCRLR
jgi:hypothetical protein